jgi:predicted transcriptional regulator
VSTREKIIGLLKEGEKSQVEIYKSLKIARSTASEILSKMERSGLIERYKDKGKTYKVRLKNLLRIGIINSAEYLHVIDFMRRLKERGFITELKVYGNGVEMMMDLCEGKIEIAISPIVSQLLFSMICNIKIVAGGMSGGAHLLLRKGIKEEDVEEIGSTLLSSMEMLTLYHFSGKDLKLRQVKSTGDYLNIAGKVNAISAWQPIALRLLDLGYYDFLNLFEPLKEINCCTLSLRESSEWETISKLYRESLSRSDRFKYIDIYSEILGYRKEEVERSYKEYEIVEEVNVKGLRGVLKKASMHELLNVLENYVSR